MLNFLKKKIKIIADKGRDKTKDPKILKGNFMKWMRTPFYAKILIDNLGKLWVQIHLEEILLGM